MFKRFYPDYRFAAVADIPDSFFRENNIQFVVLDIDNTLVAYTSPEPDEGALAFLSRLSRLGIKFCFVSNNHTERVEKFCRNMDVVYIADAKKPLRGAIYSAMKSIGADKKRTALIGDQVFTDVYAANRSGLVSVMVDAIEAKETPFFGFKRAMERIVLKGYYKGKGCEQSGRN